MGPMNLDSKYFDRIRIKPLGETVPDGTPVCQWRGCDHPGTNRAPMGRLREGEYFHFCLDHVKEYNKSYNYFAGMADAEIDAYRKDSTTGHRPTWTMGTGATDPGQAPPRRWSFRDAFGLFGGRAEAKAKPESRQRPLKNLEKRSFAALDLEGTETKAEIKARYKTLVKRLHPDANGGDRGSEDKLREIIQAYNHLKAAGFC
ncbi:MAG: DnaJ domain-containing protein [Bauldia sp.]|nr:DnaJ domain-containing protein [Bauldia sp.]